MLQITPGAALPSVGIWSTWLLWVNIRYMILYLLCSCAVYANRAVSAPHTADGAFNVMSNACRTCLLHSVESMNSISAVRQRCVHHSKCVEELQHVFFSQRGELQLEGCAAPWLRKLQKLADAGESKQGGRQELRTFTNTAQRWDAHFINEWKTALAVLQWFPKGHCSYSCSSLLCRWSYSQRANM